MSHTNVCMRQLRPHANSMQCQADFINVALIQQGTSPVSANKPPCEKAVPFITEERTHSHSPAVASATAAAAATSIPST